MNEYVYVRLKKDGTWHLTLNDWLTLCGAYVPNTSDVWWRGAWADKSESPREPLCKRCIKCREARER